MTAVMTAVMAAVMAAVMTAVLGGCDSSRLDVSVGTWLAEASIAADFKGGGRGGETETPDPQPKVNPFLALILRARYHHRTHIRPLIVYVALLLYLAGSRRH